MPRVCALEKFETQQHASLGKKHKKHTTHIFMQQCETELPKARWKLTLSHTKLTHYERQLKKETK